MAALHPSSPPTRPAQQHNCDARPRRAPSRRSAVHASAWLPAIRAEPRPPTSRSLTATEMFSREATDTARQEERDGGVERLLGCWRRQSARRSSQRGPASQRSAPEPYKHNTPLMRCFRVNGVRFAAPHTRAVKTQHSFDEVFPCQRCQICGAAYSRRKNSNTPLMRSFPVNGARFAAPHTRAVKTQHSSHQVFLCQRCQNCGARSAAIH